LGRKYYHNIPRSYYLLDRIGKTAMLKIAEEGDKDKEPGALSKTWGKAKELAGKAKDKTVEFKTKHIDPLTQPITDWVAKGVKPGEEVWNPRNPRAAGVAAGVAGIGALGTYGAYRLATRKKRKKESELDMNIYDFARIYNQKTASSHQQPFPGGGLTHDQLSDDILNLPIPQSGGSGSSSSGGGSDSDSGFNIFGRPVIRRKEWTTPEGRDTINYWEGDPKKNWDNPFEYSDSSYNNPSGEVERLTRDENKLRELAAQKPWLTGRNAAIAGGILGGGVLAAYGIHKLRQRRKQRAELAAKAGKKVPAGA